MKPIVEQVTREIIQRSRETRAAYMDRMNAARQSVAARSRISCGNLAHGFASAEQQDKVQLRSGAAPNIGIVTAYNDMLSAHQPLGNYPVLIKLAAREVGATAQVAGGVPAMCDGVTQGQPGMELSLFSRDVIAMATAVSLSHNMFDAALCLGVCDKIVPGLLIGALPFGHLPVIFVPGGPMPSGLSNPEKAEVRKRYAAGEAEKDELLEAEAKSYHSVGTCTFYGTANSNQMMMEVMGLMLPGAAFVNPNTPLRTALTRAAARRVAQMTALGNDYTPLAKIVDEKAIVNAMVGLLATGGSTNHTLHLVAMARGAGIQINWDDFDRLSTAVPLLTRIYPNGYLDVNHFQAAGGMAFLIRELIDAGLLHGDIATVAGNGLAAYENEPYLENGDLAWRPVGRESKNTEVLRAIDQAFDQEGGLKVLRGNLGRSVIKVSAVARELRVIEAPCRIFHDQLELESAFKRGELDRDFVAVIRFQGPRANGMPELHRLTTPLSVLQGRGHRVAMVTDGRMSGASGRVPAAIHLTPEAAMRGPIARLRDGDVIRLDAGAGTLEAKLPDGEFATRECAETDLASNYFGTGRELFQNFRDSVCSAEQGATVIKWADSTPAGGMQR
ncbi:MAG: phosphogluconate dehydratase [Gammaproteobacteria bacterium]|nr:phosphogluconate dehydratase [Gammaproteobacteria bacterium]